MQFLPYKSTPSPKLWPSRPVPASPAKSSSKSCNPAWRALAFWTSKLPIFSKANTFRVSPCLMHKDLGLALDLANQLGVALPATAAAREIYNAVKGAAKEDLDYSAVMKFWKR